MTDGTQMQRFRIEDDSLVQLLIESGFVCKRPDSTHVPGSISFHTNPDAGGDGRWFDTDCPIRWNVPYTLPGGRVIQNQGTTLGWIQQKKWKTLWDTEG